jgi:hypothetical protein
MPKEAQYKMKYAYHDVKEVSQNEDHRNQANEDPNPQIDV